MIRKVLSYLCRQVVFYKSTHPLIDDKYQFLMIDSLYGCRLLSCPFSDFHKTCKTCVYNFRII